MVCKKCGTNNEDDAKFCTECGSSLGDSKEDMVSKNITTENKEHDSIFRKALKKSAKSKPKGALCGMVGVQIGVSIVLFLIMFLSIAFSVANGDLNAGSVLAFSGLIILCVLLYFIFSMVISVGMMKASLFISRDESVTFGSAFKGMFKDFNCSLKAIGGMLLYSIGTGILSCVPIVGTIAALILQVYILPVMVCFVYMALDFKCKDMSMSDMFRRAMELVNGHRVEFYGLMFSFIGWMLLAFLTLGLLYIWLIPYIMLAMANWYLALNGEVNYAEGEKGLSNIAVIAVTAVGYFVFIFIIVFSVIVVMITSDVNSDELEDKVNNFTSDLIDETYDYDDTKNSDSLKNGKVVNMSGINVFVPSDYKETTMASYDKIYKSPYGEVYIGTNAQYYEGSRDEFVQTLLAQYASMGFECDTEEIRNINDVEWVTFDCDYNVNTDVYLYLTQKNGKLYYLIVTDAGDVTESGKLLDNIENKLSFAY